MNTIKLSDIISKQPVLNVGCVGHVAHGKSTVVYDLTGVRTQKHSSELERNITINLGYANLRIYRNKSTDVLSSSNVALDDENLQLVKHYSFVDCPGHQAYMATMVSGTETINVALMLIAASEDIPQPQTISHANVLGHTNIENIAILFNKIDLLTDETMVNKQLAQLEGFIHSIPKLHSKPIIPISARKKINTDQILDYLVSIPNINMEEQINQSFRMNILRSFNINKINVGIDDLKGGVIGGSVKSGYISEDDWVIIKPGIVSYHKKQKRWSCRPIISKVKSIQSDATPLTTAYPGGLIALGLDCDPAICKNNNLLGNKISKLDQTNFGELIKCIDIAVEFYIQIDYLKPKSECASINEIYLLINSSPIKGVIVGSCIPRTADTKEVDISDNDKDIFRVMADKPFAFDSAKISVLHKTAVSIELFATGTIVGIHDTTTDSMKLLSDITSSTVKIKLPSDINTLKECLNKNYPQITVKDDISEHNIPNKKLASTVVEIKSKITDCTTPKVMVKITLPEPLFKIETNRFDWTNAKAMIDKFNIDTIPELKCKINHSMIQRMCFGKMIIRYFNYEYMSDAGLADINDDRIILHIKRNTKNKPKDVISRFIKQYHWCKFCNSLTSRINKIGSQYSSICILCDNRVLINDEWIKTKCT